MQRVTITIDDELAAELDRFMAARGYANRSEAIRDLARSGLQQAATEVGGPRLASRRWFTCTTTRRANYRSA